MHYTELQVTSNFSFLQGCSHPEELVEQATALGHKAIAITDHNTLAGIVRAHAAAREAGIRIIPACRLNLIDGPSLLAYPTSKEGYGRLSALLTEGNLRAEKGECHLYKADVYRYAQGILFIVIPPAALNSNFEFDPAFHAVLAEYRQVLGDSLFLALSRSYVGDDTKKMYRLSQLSTRLDVPLVAVNNVYYHHPKRRQLQDILTCILEDCTIDKAGFKLFPNAERYLKPTQEMIRLFRQYPDAILRTQQIADACRFSLDELKYEYPTEITSEARSPQQELVRLTWEGAYAFYGDNLPEKIITSIQHEMQFIEEMDYAPYFLTVYDIVRFARQQGILCQGRGSAANSAVCFCLGITSVDPTKFELLFERFISSARNEPPDIDVDFEHERREEVIQYIYNKYGRDRAAIVATVTTQHEKGAVRDVAKAMGLSVDAINRLAACIWDFIGPGPDNDLRMAEHGFNPLDPHLLKILDLTRQYMGFPRQLGQHTGGFVITRFKLSDLCPVMNARMQDRTNIEWNKDDIDALGFLKIDILALGMLTCIRKAFDMAKAHYGLDLTLANIPQDDPLVYDMISRADTIGVFQIESRAQMAMLPRMKPNCFYDLVIEVALVRPGPIQGNMVHPYLRRRNGEEPVEYPSKELEEILGRTLGVPLFQEQAMKIAIVAAGFSGAEADQLRRSMATFKIKTGAINKFEKMLIDGMVARGYQHEFAERIFKQLQGFGSYGFPESHAASFALLVYVSCWLKYYYPDIFAAALLNSQPLGFYQPAQIVQDAAKHGVPMQPVDINYSDWDNLLEDKTGKYHALRLGFRQINNIRQQDMQLLITARSKPYSSIHALRDIGVSAATLEKLADADAFRSIGLDRRQALWEVSALGDRPVGLFSGQASQSEGEQVQLPVMSASEHVVQDYASTALSLKAHPISFVRQDLALLKAVCNQDLGQLKDGTILKVAGLILVRQRPATAKGVCFITLEDETGVANLVVFQNLYEKYRKEILQSKLLMVEGKLQREGQIIHVIVRRCFDLSGLLRKLTAIEKPDQPVLTLSRSDEKNPYQYQPKEKKAATGKDAQTEMFPGGRNFK